MKQIEAVRVNVMLSRRALLGGAGAILSSCVSSSFARSHNGHNLPRPAVLKKAKPPLPVIMLDPGHGGKDPGAIGITGLYEKHVAQSAALELRKLLLATGRYRVVMTRTEDKFIPLDGRVDLAHHHQADLFMSLHADALHDCRVSGASVYTRAHGASDYQTEQLAKKENSADRFGGPKFTGVSKDVAEILGSLTSEETRHHSSHFAAQVVESLRPKIKLLHNPTRHAAFVVLKSTDIPSILVEMGFMSNHLDESALKQAGHRNLVARALKSAIDQYFIQNKFYGEHLG